MFFGLASALGIELGDFREGYSHELEKEVPLKTKYYTKSRIFTEVEIDKRKMQEK